MPQRRRGIGKAHGGPGGSLDLLVGQIEPRTAVALYPIAAIGRKDHHLVVVIGHVPTVLPSPSISSREAQSAVPRAFAAGPVGKGNYGSEPMAMTDEDLIEEVGRRLVAAAPGAEIILFGPRAHGEARPDSDLDLLVIEPDFTRRCEEYGRLRKELRGLGVAIDLVIYRRHEAEERCGVPGSLLHRALREGRVLSGA